MAKNFLQIFNKYTPSEDEARILLSAQNIKIQADKENRFIQASVDFESLVSKDVLYKIERDIAKAYDLNWVKLLPHYPASLFDSDYVSELLKETECVGIVARGFFNKYRYIYEDKTLTVEIPFTSDGVRLLCDARTPEVMQGIIMSEFGLAIKVNIIHTEDELFFANNNSLDRALEEFDKRLAAEAKSYENRASAAAPVEEEALPRVQTLSKLDHTPEMNDGICKIGVRSFDISSPEYVYGDMFEITPTPIAEITTPMKNVVVVGTTFGYTCELNRAGDKFNISFSTLERGIRE